MNNTSALRDRYPGLNSFRAEEETIFFGRQRETSELLQMVRAEQAVVLFSKSGLGKSSLLNAGLVPAMRLLNFHPIRVRFQQEKATTGDTSVPTTPVAVMLNSLNGEFQEAYTRLGQTPPQPTILFDANLPRLWEQIKARPFPNNQVPVFLFDQFEEFFAYPQEQQKDFASQLAELLHDQAPARVINWLLDLDNRTPETIAWSQQPPIKCVFAIRADRLADMHSLKLYISLILRNRYELSPLQQEAARDAMSRPAGLPQPTGPFATPSFTYHPPTLEMILDELSNEDCEIEGAQLQIVCQYVEDRLKEEFRDVVDQQVVSGRREVMRILDKFYRTQLHSIGDVADIEAASNVLENELVEGGRRVGLSEPKMMRLLGTTFTDDHKREIIRHLQDARLIRSETTHLGATYELTHDTLIDPVSKARRVREAWQKRRTDREDVQRKDRALKEQAEKLRQETEAKERALRAEAIAYKAKEEAEKLEKEKDAQLQEKLKLQVEREQLLDEAQRGQDRYKRLTYLFLLISLGVLALLVYGLQQRIENQRILKSLIKLRAVPEYEQGRHAIAYRLWETIDNTEEYRFAPYAGKDVQIDTNQHYVASLSPDETLSVWKRRVNAPDSLVYQTRAALFLLAGSSLGVYRSDTSQPGYMFQIINLKTGKNALLYDLPVRNTLSAKFSGDGRYVIITDRYSQPHLFALAGQPQDEVCVFNETLMAAPRSTLSSPNTMATFSPQNHYVIVNGDGRSWVFDLLRSTLVTSLKQLASFKFSDDDKQLSLLTETGHVSLLDLQTGNQRPVGVIPEVFEYAGPVLFAPNGKYLLIGTTYRQSDSIATQQINLFDLQRGIRQLSVKNVDEFWPFESVGQLIYTSRQNPNQPVRYALPNKRLDGFPATFKVVKSGHTHVLLRIGNQPELRDLRLNTPFVGALPDLTKNPSLAFYAPDGRTDTHLIALYTDYVQIIDLATGQEEQIKRSNRPFGAVTLAGNLLRVRLGDRHLDPDQRQNRQYWAFFINNKQNQPDYLRRYVYPELTAQQRNTFGLPK
ncbi:hypothetical protein GCM10027592_17270 [Spirosoma flavus]